MLEKLVRPILDLTDDELRSWLTDKGQPGYRAAQIRGWIFERRAITFDQMSDLPQPLRQTLADEFTILTSKVALHRSAADGTEKLLLDLADEQRIECVLIREYERRTICISTQVGCAMGCVFCASGLDGVVRNLSRGEIIEQMLHLARLLPAEERLSNIVVMGMGEPLANLPRSCPLCAKPAVRKVWESARARSRYRPSGCRRRWTGSRPKTASITWPSACTRRTTNCDAALVPVSRNIPLDTVLAAADRFFDANHRRLTFEYVLLGEVNDRPEHARALARLLAGRMALLNVIPYNPVAGLSYRTPAAQAQQEFLRILERAGINVQVRTRKGDRIDAACGQLRRSQIAPAPATLTSE